MVQLINICFIFLFTCFEFWNFLIVLELMLYERDHRSDCSLPEE